MARHPTNTVDYFPHDAHASDNDTLTILEGQFGNDGYAFWFKLMERISTTENHIIDCRNTVKYKLLLAKSHVTPEKGEAILDLLASLGAIDTELWKHKLIWAQEFVDGVADAYKNRRRPVPTMPIPTPEIPIPTVETPISTGDSTQTKRKETKRKETKIEGFKLPSYIEQETWDAFIEVRKAKKAVNTTHALNLIITDIEKLKAQGFDPKEVLNQSISNGYKGVFPLKGDSYGGTRKHQEFAAKGQTTDEERRAGASGVQQIDLSEV